MSKKNRPPRHVHKNRYEKFSQAKTPQIGGSRTYGGQVDAERLTQELATMPKRLSPKNGNK
ncbi:MAG: hypothetical protein ABIG30_00840 [Candidatus Aenigmatarchaeota archaeon]